ncbi:hypothetical protein GCM10023168_23210 [Fodinibacter luteus]|uniref:Uncharacterized protein n=1 Tax=Fodinibacter luteus TaxID=552064 RepID=A0ABP8KHM8_9MICO
MDTNSTLETILTLAALGGLVAPVAYLMERTNRRVRREHGARTSWAWTGHDADSRRVADEIHALDGSAHR